MDKQQMLKLRLGGRTYQYIAEEAGISRQRVQQLLSPPSQIRNLIIRKSNGHCVTCGIYVGKTGHVHHTNSVTEENYNDIENLCLLCLSCHRKEHDYLWNKQARNQKIWEYWEKGWLQKSIANMFKMNVHAVTMVIARERARRKKEQNEKAMPS